MFSIKKRKKEKKKGFLSFAKQKMLLQTALEAAKILTEFLQKQLKQAKNSRGTRGF